MEVASSLNTSSIHRFLDMEEELTTTVKDKRRSMFGLQRESGVLLLCKFTYMYVKLWQ